MIFVLTEKKELFLKADNESDAMAKIKETQSLFPGESAKYLRNPLHLIEASDIISAKSNINNGKKLQINNGSIQWMIL